MKNKLSKQIKVGATVSLRSGKDAGKEFTVSEIDRKTLRIKLVDGLQLVDYGTRTNRAKTFKSRSVQLGKVNLVADKPVEAKKEKKEKVEKKTTAKAKTTKAKAETK